MAVTVTHATVTAVPDDPAYDIGSDEWNAAHTVTGLGTAATAATTDFATAAQGATADSAVQRAGDTMTGALVVGNVVTSPTTVAGLTAAQTGARSFVTDANATTFASIVAGGGANGVPVYYDGTNWRIG